MRLSDLISSTMPAGSALFLQWQGYHVFSIPKREVLRSSVEVRFFGVGGKRSCPEETFADCALRESLEEIGAVVSHLESAKTTYFLKASGRLERLTHLNEQVRPRLILEKRRHSGYGSMTEPGEPYYLVAFDGKLIAQPYPQNEIAALIYLKSEHLQRMQSQGSSTIADLQQRGAKINYQRGWSLAETTVLTPHGTASFLVKQPF